MEQGFRLVLASNSPRRRELLTQVGLEYEVVPGQGEEFTEKTSPDEQVMDLSAAKAREVAGRIEMDEDTVVLGADTMVYYWGQALGKPADKEEAAMMLNTLQGNVHQVYTGVTLIYMEDGQLKEHSFFECTDVTVTPMNVDEIEEYIATGDPMDKAGAYGIQGFFARYIQAICGDYNNVVGLPVGRVCQELKRLLFL